MKRYKDDMDAKIRNQTDFKHQFDDIFNGMLSEEPIKNEALLKLDAKLQERKELKIAKNEG